MSMLDAALAFVLTIAALATVVTLVMEVFLRLFRVRKGNLIIVLKRLSKEIPEGQFKLNAQRRWDFITKVLNNPTITAGTLPDSASLLGSSSDSGRLGKIFKKIYELLGWNTDSKSLPTAIGKSRVFKGLPAGNQPSDQDWEGLIEGLGRKHGVRGIYDKVSLEHILRRFSEVPEVQSVMLSARKSAEEELDRLGRKFEEFSSGASANFKRRSKLWSAVIGVILALAVNIDAARIFQSYLKDQKLTQTVIAKYTELEKSANDITERYDELMKNTEKTDQNADEAAEQLDKAEAALKQASVTLAALSDFGIPMGSGYFPHCRIAPYFSDDQTEKCLPGERKASLGRGLLWFLSSVFSGLLIGLGAPFWFDVAKRLSAVRTMFGGTASTEERLSGKDAAGKPIDRRKMVKRVMTDALNAPSPRRGRLVLRPDGEPFLQE
jgi:hypothetical protein